MVSQVPSDSLEYNMGLLPNLFYKIIIIIKKKSIHRDKAHIVLRSSKRAEKIFQAPLAAALVVLSQENLAETLDNPVFGFSRLGGSGARSWSTGRGGGGSGGKERGRRVEKQ